MSKKITTSKKVAAPKAKKAAAKATVAAESTPVRYSALPKLVAAAPAVKLAVTRDDIARKAFELFAAGRGGSELDHWFAAEAELKVAA